MRRYPTITYSYHSICFSSLLIETATEQFFCILCQKHKRRLGYWKKRVLYFDIFANQNICQWQAQQPAKNEKKRLKKCSSSWRRKKMFNSSPFSSEKGLILADFCTSSKTPWDGSNMAMVCSGLGTWCVSPGYCHGSAKGCHHGHPQPLKPIPEVQHSVERKRNSSSFPSPWGKWPKRKWFGRAERLQFLQISPFSPRGRPDTDPSYSGWIETFDTLGPGSKHKTVKFIVNSSFSKFAHALETEPLLLTDQSLGPLFPSPSLCGSPLHSWTCFKGR